MITPIKYFINAILIVLAQVLVFNRIEVGFGVYLMVYPLFVLTLPFRMNMFQGLLISFLIGIAIDFFSNTYGLHASALVFAFYIRSFVFKIFPPHEDYARGEDGTRYASAGRFFMILISFIFLHHIWYFLLESFNLKESLFTLVRILLSTIASTIVAQLLFLMFAAKTNIER